ncbi:unnamed protein product [Acanthoscelides obtectus]|uniref:FHA domain-containing protein n=1 Tax=Acanthoscelides obtectus TaxID=200917 RepID=A0A9P0JJ16_ACAOB|nr:unnamed protein product [Acanthoscelides obtectus]CAK1661504.1 Nibrin [Acanthoscelides obtectus]
MRVSKNSRWKNVSRNIKTKLPLAIQIMLFSLTNTHTGTKFYLLQTKYEVGRKNCSFLIENDVSISRKHAVIEVQDDKVTVTDAGSKYKSLLNGKSMEPNVACVLKHGDEIQFGVYNSKFRLEREKYVTTATRLPGAEKIQLKNDIEAVRGSYVEDWSHDCTHLTVKEIALTVKVLYALIDDKPIVLPQYWTKLKDHVRSGEEFPKVENYNNPPVSGTLLSRVEWKRGINRRNMFKNKLFIFLTENNKQIMEGVIARLGGTSIAWEKKPMPLQDIEKSPKQIIVVQPLEKTQNSSFQELVELVSKRGQRLIPQQEIALAVVSGNCEKDCNPEFDRASEVFCNVSKCAPSQSTVLAQNTEDQAYSQDLCNVKKEKPDIVIRATYSPENNTTKSEKAPSSVDDIMEENQREIFKRPNDAPLTNASKKIRTEDIEWISGNSSRNEPVEIVQPKATETQDTTPVNAQKRKASDDSDEENSATENPFLKIGKKTKRQDKNHPFKTLTRSSKEDLQPDLRMNPFWSSRSAPKVKKEGEDKNTAKVLSSTANTSVLEQPSLEYSRIKTTDENLNATWISKNGQSTCVEVKEELQCQDDDYIIEFRNQFRDKVVIECFAKVIEKRNNDITDRVDSSVSNGRVNFKKFRKVTPIYVK